MKSQRIQGHVLSLLLLVSLTACSGAGDTPPPAPPIASATSAEGFWNGMNGTNNRTVTGVVLNDGVYWFLYSVENNPAIIAGVVQGNSTSQNGVLTSSDATDFSVERTPLILNPTVDGSYTVKQSLSGAITYPAAPQSTFTTTYDSTYESAADINAIVGTYVGPVAVSETAEVTVLSTGAIFGKSNTSPECTFTGSVSPRTQGNVFDVTIKFDGQSTCGNGSDTVKGVGFLRGGKLYSAALNDDKTNGVVFLGTKL